MITTLALDLEGTLLSNAMSQIPRPGLYDFLVGCEALFGRIVIFTAVAELRFRSIAALLAAEGHAPGWFADIEYVQWNGETKDLTYVHGVEPGEVLLVDDLQEYVHPGQEDQWVRVAPFVAPYSSSDDGLRTVLQTLAARRSA